MGKNHFTIEQLLAQMKPLGASDLHIKVGIPPTYRINGHLRAVAGDPISEEEADHMLDAILNQQQQERFEAGGNLDFAWHLPDGDRFRINMFRSGAHRHVAIRRVQAEIPTYEELHLPPVYHDLISKSHVGLILVVGVTGSGKSSTLAAMIDQINATRSVNIITIEDPVEYRFIPKKAIISQREIGIDVDDFATALKFVVRQDPDVIFIGEMRDHDTIIAAIQAAETGHLVFATLHSADTMQAFGRILEFFPQNERGFIRSSLSNSLLAICAQRLIPALDDFAAGVVPATEVLINTSLVREKIRDEEEEDLPAIIASNPNTGMHNFNQSLARMVQDNWIDRRVALNYAPNREALDALLKGIDIKSSGLVGR
ncbi:MAG: type IV pilus twitching motility protein PilT [Phycisphaeraceae bacterium]